MHYPITDNKFDSGDFLTLEQLQEIPILKEIPESLLIKKQKSIVQKKIHNGETVCKEGEYGYTCFYILKGCCNVFVTSIKVDTQPHHTTPLQSIRSKFLRLFQDIKYRTNKLFRVFKMSNNTPVNSENNKYKNQIGKIEEGELFGEMTCMSHYPRSATVIASDDCIILEMLSDMLDLLRKKSKTLKEQLDNKYKQHAIISHLRKIPLFSDISDDFLFNLSKKVELLHIDPGTVICYPGDSADSFFLIRQGFVKVSQNHPGGELILSYLRSGQFFGEMALLSKIKRTASCTAIDNVEVVKIYNKDFKHTLEKYPSIKLKLEKIATERSKLNRQKAKESPNLPIDEFLEKGLMSAQSALLIDLERCTRCDACVNACAVSHGGVTRLFRVGFKYDKYLVTSSCRSCKDPVCMVGCPVGAIRRKMTLEIVIEDWCIGCELCAKKCPYGNITVQNYEVYDKEQRVNGIKKPVSVKKAVICDLGASSKVPACVYACPHQASFRVNPQEFFSKNFKHI